MLRSLAPLTSPRNGISAALPRIVSFAIAAILCLLSAQVSHAVTINVTNACPLPAAITAANNDSNSHDTDCTAGIGSDTIDLANMASEYDMTAAFDAISSDITIEGRGKTVDAENNYRIFRVSSGGKLTLKNLSITRGNVTGDGGGILVNIGGTAKLIGVTVYANNSAVGGGVHSSGNLTIENSIFRSNISTGAGGGLYIAGGSASISRSVFKTNTATVGGGILSTATLTIDNSSIHDNTASGSTNGGGGILVAGGTATLTHVTLYKNALTGTGSSGTDLLVQSLATAYLRNSIVSDNDDTDNTNNCVLSSGVSLAQNVGNLISNGNGNCTSTPDNAHMGTEQSGPLSFFVYYPLTSSSEAIGIGAASYCAQHRQDLLGIYRPASGCDAGAAEFGGEYYINVSSTCSLANAINSAENNSATGGCRTGVADDMATDVIWLNADVSYSGAIAGIHSALPQINSVMIVDGGGYTASKASGGNFRLFDVFSGGDLTLRNITVSGFTQTSGGAVFNRDTLRLEDCVFVGNSDVSGAGGGGALHLGSGQTSTTINRCAFIQNDSLNDAGGAIRSGGGNLTVTNSSFIGNTCATDGCAIQIDGGTVELSHNTYWNNASDTSGNTSGVHGGGGTVDMLNSIIGRDTTTGGRLCGGSFNNHTAERGIIMWNGPTQNNPCGNVTVADPRLGGQTGFPPYLPLGAGSAAIGKGIDSTCARYPTDQRGAARPDTRCDSGAVQYISSPSSTAAESVSTWVDPAESAAPEPTACTGELLNNTGSYRITVSYGLCAGAQFNRLELSAIGIGYVIQAGPLDAIDVWGWVTSGVEVCFKRHASTLFLDAANSPRTVEQLASTRDGDWTCAAIEQAGTIVLMPVDSYLTTPPADAGSSAPGAGVSAGATSLADCMVELLYALNFRETPGGTIMMQLPHRIRLTAFQRAGGLGRGRLSRDTRLDQRAPCDIYRGLLTPSVPRRVGGMEIPEHK